MFSICRFRNIYPVLGLFFCTFTLAFAQGPVKPNSLPVTTRIRVDERSMIIVPVSINGSRPYDFLLDTGSGKSMIDRKLADQLGLPQVNERNVTGALASARMSVARIETLSVSGVTVSGGEVYSPEHVPTVTEGVRGVLGEDFLSNFDVLLDYRHWSLELDAPLGAMAQTAAGEHLALELTGNHRGNLTHNRLMLSGHVQAGRLGASSSAEPGDGSVSLLLDSGANQLTLFAAQADAAAGHTETVRAGNLDHWVAVPVSTGKLDSVHLGNRSLPNVTAVTLYRRAEVDSDGLLPPSLFHSVLISAQGKFVILDPTFPKPGHDSGATGVMASGLVK